MLSGLFLLAFVVFFWWATITGAKTLMRRFFSFFFAPYSTDRSFGEQRFALAADEYRPLTIESVTNEMEATLAKERASAADLLGQASERHALLKDAQKTMSAWDDKARSAIQAGRDDLARAALAERLKTSEWADALRGEIARIDDLLRGYQADIRGLQTRLGEVYRRRSLASSRIDRANDGVAAFDLLHDKWDQAAPGLDTLDRSADYAEARLEAMSLGAPTGFGRRIVPPAGTPGAGAQLLAPLPGPPSAIDEALAAMKAKLATSHDPRASDG